MKKIILFLLIANLAYANIYWKCYDLFRSLRFGTQSPLQAEQVDDQVAIVFYPRAYHAELKVGNQLISFTRKRGIKPRSMEGAIRSSRRRDHKGLIAFHLRVTREELERIKFDLRTHKNTSRFCMGKTSMVIVNNTSMLMPPLVTHLPIFNSIHLALRKVFSGKNGRVSKIVFHAKSSDFKDSFWGRFAVESIFVGLATVIVYYVVDGVIKEIIVPIVLSHE